MNVNLSDRALANLQKTMETLEMIYAWKKKPEVWELTVVVST
jgi:hypothetical protein